MARSWAGSYGQELSRSAVSWHHQVCAEPVRAGEQPLPSCGPASLLPGVRESGRAALTPPLALSSRLKAFLGQLGWNKLWGHCSPPPPPPVGVHTGLGFSCTGCLACNFQLESEPRPDVLLAFGSPSVFGMLAMVLALVWGEIFKAVFLGWLVLMSAPPHVMSREGVSSAESSWHLGPPLQTAAPRAGLGWGHGAG